MSVTRRSFFAQVGAIAVGQGLVLNGQQQPPARGQQQGGAQQQQQQTLDPRMATAPEDMAKQFGYVDRRAKVSLVRGENQRQNIIDALTAIDDQIQPVLKTRKYVIIKPNGLNPNGRTGATRAATIHGVLDYLAPRFKGPVVISDCANTPATQVVGDNGWDKIFAEHKPLALSVEVINELGRSTTFYGIDYDMHLIPIRMGARFVDPGAFVISASVLKTHNMVVATLSAKNILVGCAMTPPPGSNRPRGESDKRKYHVGIRGANYNLYRGIEKMSPTWGLGIIDGFEGMEGNGPWSGLPVPHRIAIASTDFLAADRVGLECMSIDASWPGYLVYAHEAGLGQYDLAKIDVVGAKIADVQRKYLLHADTDKMLEWRGPMQQDYAPNLGYNRPTTEEEFKQYERDV
jgi:uncharacterized protein (DUF362 family)